MEAVALRRNVPRHRLARRKLRKVSIVLATSTIGLSTIGVLAISGKIAGAATDTVTTCNGAGPGSLPATVTSAGAGDTVNFSVTCPATSPIVLAAPMDITTNLTIDGPGANRLVVSGNNAVEAFEVASGVTATISGITIENGNSGTGNGGAIYNSGTLTVSSSTLSGNTAASGQGGAIFNNGSPMLTVENSTLLNNTATSGGALADGIIAVTNSTLSNNVATGYGGGAIFAGALTVSDSTLAGNTASSGYGGGIFNNEQTSTVSNSTLARKSSDNRRRAV